MADYSTLEMLIDGRFVSGGGRSTAQVLNPVDASVIADLPEATTSDLDEALAAAERAFPLWSATTALERSKIMRRAAQLMRDRVERIAVIMTLEQGKPLAEARAEIEHGADVIDWYAEEGRRTYGRVVPSRTPGLRMSVIRQPVGVAAAFTPWNFPILTPARKIGGALAAGCTIVIKPSEEVPGSAVEMARCFAEAGLPKGVLNVVFGDAATVSKHLIASPIVRKVSFTGSTAIGKILAKQCAEDLKRTTMELGGHGPVVVFDDVDAEKVAETAALGKYRNAGQVCVSPTRFFVQEAVYDRFLGRFTEVARNLRVGNGLDDGTQMGPLANARRVEAMEEIIQDVEDRGGKVQVGGRRRGNDGYFFDPSVVTDIGDDSRIMTDEPFGPIAPVVPFADFDEVVSRANSLPYGLAGFAFTTSAKRMMDISEQLATGMVGVNTFGISQPETPFGGINDSGHGSEGGTEGLEAYLNTKLISVG